MKMLSWSKLVFAKKRRASRRLGALVLAVSSLVTANECFAGELLYKCSDISRKAQYIAIGPNLIQGTDGWFFRSSDLEIFFEFSDETIKTISRINDALGSRGTHLIFLPMIPKGLAAGSYLPNGGILGDRIFDYKFARKSYSSFIEGVNKQNIDAVDIVSILENQKDFDSGNLFFKRDLHWTPEGSKLVASAVAAEIIKRGVTEPEVNFTTEKLPGREKHRSNFTIMLNEVCDEKVPTEDIDIYVTKRIVDTLDSLFTEEQAEAERPLVHLVGSSFTDEAKQYNFSGFLKQSLSREVEAFAVAGGGINESIYWWTQNPVGNAKRPKYLIWETPNLNDFATLAREMNDTIVPAIVGECEADRQLSQVSFGDGSAVEVDLPELKGDPGNFYLSYTFENKALKSFVSTYSYSDGAERKVKFTNPTRVGGLSMLFQALPSGTKVAPSHVRLDLGDGMKSAGSVKLCSYPQGVFQSESTSN